MVKITIFLSLILNSINVISADFERITGKKESYTEKWNKSKKPVHKALTSEKYKKQKKAINSKYTSSKKIPISKTKSNLAGLKKQAQITNGTKGKVNNIINKQKSVSKSKQRRQQFAKKRAMKR